MACGPVSGEVRVGVFEVDASPPVGSPMAYDPVKGVEMPLSFRGVVITGSGRPIVLGAIDWIGISNGGHTEFREALAEAAGTDAGRVAVHALHQHDAPRCDFSAEALLNEAGIKGAGFDPEHARKVMAAAAEAAKVAVVNARAVTHLGVGSGVVEKVASNRRILGEDGKVLHTRYTATRDPAVRAYPEGVIDPELKMVSFWDGDEAVAVLTYYATHPQSYYRTGLANPDFPGMARNAREEETGVPHVHFNGAGGNIGAGKWNDGAVENRQVLADRVAAGMKAAWESTEKAPLLAGGITWAVEELALPVSEDMDEGELVEVIADRVAPPPSRYMAAKHLAWLRRCRSGDTVEIACLGLNGVRVLHMPGELFVEYQLAAQEMRRDLFVAMAAYGDYAPGYIGTEISYSQGGYESSPGASKVSPAVEGVLMGAMK